MLFALVAAPFIGEHLFYNLSKFHLKPGMSKILKGMLLATLLGWSVYPLSGVYYLDMEIPGRTGLGVTSDFFPHELPDFIRQHDIKGQVYNTNRLGGFYLYHLYPDRIPFMDGRWETMVQLFLLPKTRRCKILLLGNSGLNNMISALYFYITPLRNLYF